MSWSRWDTTPSIQGVTQFQLRAEQLTFRAHEINIAYERFCQWIKKENLEFETVDGVEIDHDSWSALDNLSNLPPVRFDNNVGLVGHSFGGCTIVSEFSLHLD